MPRLNGKDGTNAPMDIDDLPLYEPSFEDMAKAVKISEKDNGRNRKAQSLLEIKGYGHYSIKCSIRIVIICE